MLKIGISACFFYPDSERSTFWSKQLCFVEKEFANFWASFGVLPILIPDLSESNLTSLVNELDGLVLHGGADIAPETYGEKPLDANKWKGDAYRDQYELRLIQMALNRDIPIFGVCRGLQLLNVFFGGSLIQDIPSVFESDLVHFDRSLYDNVIHPVEFCKYKLLHQLSGVENQMVNSIHHQGIKKLGKNLEVLAKAPDGMIEAIHSVNLEKGYVIAVQWHPEFSKNSTKSVFDDKILVDFFLENCSKRSSVVL